MLSAPLFRPSLRPWIAASLAVILLAGCGEKSPLEQMDADRLIDFGAEEAGSSSWDSAAEAFSLAEAKAASGSPQQIKAIYGRAVCAHQRIPASEAGINEATALYQKVIAVGGHSSEAGLAYYQMGQIAATSDYFQDVEDLPKAREYYQKCIDGWEGQDCASLAALALADAWVASLEPDNMRKGCEFLEGWLAKHPDDSYAVVMWSWLGNTWHSALGDSARAVACFKKADALGLVPNGRQHEVLWRIARLAERDLKDRDTAIAYYTKLIKERPSSGKGWEAQQRLKALGAPVPELKLFSSDSIQRARAAQRNAATSATAPAASATEARR